MTSTWIGSMTRTPLKTVADSPYQAIQGELVSFDTSAGPVEILAPLSPLENSVFAVHAVNTSGFDLTIDGNGNTISNVDVDDSPVASITGFVARLFISYYFDGVGNWAPLNSSSAADKILTLSKTVQIAGTNTAVAFTYHRYDPSAGSMVIELPAAPFFRMRAGILNIGPNPTPITIAGNGNNFQNGGYNLVASDSTTAPNARAVWEYDGANWVLVDFGGGFTTGANMASLGRPLNGTVDVTYLAGWNPVVEFTLGQDGNLLDADFAAGTITINRAGAFNIYSISTLAGKTGSRTDLAIGVAGLPEGDHWISGQSGLDQPYSFRPEISNLEIITPPVVVSLLVSNDAAGNKDVRVYALSLVVEQL